MRTARPDAVVRIVPAMSVAVRSSGTSARAAGPTVIRVRSDSSPALRPEGQTDFDVTVEVLSMERTAAGFRLSWNRTPGMRYQVQYKKRLSDSDWLALDNLPTGNDAVLQVVDPEASIAPERYYRILYWPD